MVVLKFEDVTKIHWHQKMDFQMKKLVDFTSKYYDIRIMIRNISSRMVSSRILDWMG